MKKIITLFIFSINIFVCANSGLRNYPTPPNYSRMVLAAASFILNVHAAIPQKLRRAAVKRAAAFVSQIDSRSMVPEVTRRSDSRDPCVVVDFVRARL